MTIIGKMQCCGKLGMRLCDDCPKNFLNRLHDETKPNILDYIGKGKAVGVVRDGDDPALPDEGEKT